MFTGGTGGGPSEGPNLRTSATLDSECGQLEAADGVGVCGDEEEVVANGKGGNVGGQLREKNT